MVSTRKLFTNQHLDLLGNPYIKIVLETTSKEALQTWLALLPNQLKKCYKKKKEKKVYTLLKAPLGYKASKDQYGCTTYSVTLAINRLDYVSEQMYLVHAIGNFTWLRYKLIIS